MWRASGRWTAALLQIGVEDGHLEIVGALAVLVVDEQDPDEFFADIDLGGIFFLRPRHHPDARIAEQSLQISVVFPDFLDVHRFTPDRFTPDRSTPDRFTPDPWGP